MKMDYVNVQNYDNLCKSDSNHLSVTLTSLFLSPLCQYFNIYIAIKTLENSNVLLFTVCNV